MSLNISADMLNKGKLIHVTGKADTDDTVKDPVFEVSAKALKLERIVEMYQWKESSNTTTKKKLGGGKKNVTTYSYSKRWSGRVINSSHFKKPDGHENPGTMPFKSTTLFAGKVALDAFILPRSLVKRIGGGEQLSVGPADVPTAISNRTLSANGGFYIGASPDTPEVGDMQVTFNVVRPVEVSIISRQVGNTFEPYQTKAGGTIELLKTGIHTAASMFKSEQDSKKTLTWILHLIGFVLMLIGFSMMFRPLSVVADVVPLFCSIVGVGTGIIAFLISLLLSLFTIGIAWVFYRPVLGGSLLVIAVVLVVLTRGKLKSAKA